MGVNPTKPSLSLIYYLTHVHIDFGTRSLLASECERVGIKKPLIVTDAGARGRCAADGARRLAASLQAPIYDRTPSNAPSAERRARASRVLSGAVPT